MAARSREKDLTPAQVKELTGLLEEKRTELLEDLKMRRAGSANNESRQGDEADQASEDAEVALETRLMDRDAKLLREVERALEKVKVGTFGLCEGTDEPIGFEVFFIADELVPLQVDVDRMPPTAPAVSEDPLFSVTQRRFERRGGVGLARGHLEFLTFDPDYGTRIADRRVIEAAVDHPSSLAAFEDKLAHGHNVFIDNRVPWPQNGILIDRRIGTFAHIAGDHEFD